MAKTPRAKAAAPPPSGGSVLDAIDALEARRRRKPARAAAKPASPSADLDLDFIR